MGCFYICQRMWKMSVVGAVVERLVLRVLRVRRVLLDPKGLLEPRARKG